MYMNDTLSICSKIRWDGSCNELSIMGSGNDLESSGNINKTRMKPNTTLGNSDIETSPYQCHNLCRLEKAKNGHIWYRKFFRCWILEIIGKSKIFNVVFDIHQYLRFCIIFSFPLVQSVDTQETPILLSYLELYYFYKSRCWFYTIKCFVGSCHEFW